MKVLEVNKMAKLTEKEKKAFDVVIHIILSRADTKPGYVRTHPLATHLEDYKKAMT